MRTDGERVYIYARLTWEPARAGAGASYEFRWRGRTAALLTRGAPWKNDMRLNCVLGGSAGINEQDLLDISLQLSDING